MYATFGPRGSNPASSPAAQLAIVNADPRSTIAGIVAGLHGSQRSGHGEGAMVGVGGWCLSWERRKQQRHYATSRCRLGVQMSMYNWTASLSAKQQALGLDKEVLLLAVSRRDRGTRSGPCPGRRLLVICRSNRFSQPPSKNKNLSSWKAATDANDSTASSSQGQHCGLPAISCETAQAHDGAHSHYCIHIYLHTYTPYIVFFTSTE